METESEFVKSRLHAAYAVKGAWESHAARLRLEYRVSNGEMFDNARKLIRDATHGTGRVELLAGDRNKATRKAVVSALGITPDSKNISVTWIREYLMVAAQVETKKHCTAVENHYIEAWITGEKYEACI